MHKLMKLTAYLELVPAVIIYYRTLWNYIETIL